MNSKEKRKTAIHSQLFLFSCLARFSASICHPLLIDKSFKDTRATYRTQVPTPKSNLGFLQTRVCCEVQQQQKSFDRSRYESLKTHPGAELGKGQFNKIKERNWEQFTPGDQQAGRRGLGHPRNSWKNIWTIPKCYVLVSSTVTWPHKEMKKYF